MPNHPSNLKRCLHRWTIVIGLSLNLSVAVSGQEATSPRTFHLGIQLEAEQPAAWLADQFRRDPNPPYMPGFWTGALEWGYSNRHTLQIGVGLRRDLYYAEGCWILPMSGFKAGHQLTLAWRDYFLSRPHHPLSGPYYMPVLGYTRAVHALRYTITKELTNVTEVRAWTAGAGVGWQQAIGRLRLDFGVSGVLGYQWYPQYEEYMQEHVTPLDRTQVRLWEQAGGESPRWIGLGWTASLAVGWLVF